MKNDAPLKMFDVAKITFVDKKGKALPEEYSNARADIMKKEILRRDKKTKKPNKKS